MSIFMFSSVTINFFYEFLDQVLKRKKQSLLYDSWKHWTLELERKEMMTKAAFKIIMRHQQRVSFAAMNIWAVQAQNQRRVGLVVSRREIIETQMAWSLWIQECKQVQKVGKVIKNILNQITKRPTTRSFQKWRFQVHNNRKLNRIAFKVIIRVSYELVRSSTAAWICQFRISKKRKADIAKLSSRTKCMYVSRCFEHWKISKKIMRR